MARVTTEEVSYTDGEPLMGIFVRADGNRICTRSYGVLLRLPSPAASCWGSRPSRGTRQAKALGLEGGPPTLGKCSTRHDSEKQHLGASDRGVGGVERPINGCEHGVGKSPSMLSTGEGARPSQHAGHFTAP